MMMATRHVPAIPSTTIRIITRLSRLGDDELDELVDELELAVDEDVDIFFCWCELYNMHWTVRHIQKKFNHTKG